MPERIYIKSFGCQMNVAESDQITTALSSDYIVTQLSSEADFLIFNTCSVRQSAEKHAEGFISQIRGEMKANAKIILTGCMVNDSLDNLKKKYPYVDYFVTNNDKSEIIRYLNKEKDKTLFDNRSSYTFKKLYYKKGDFFSYVPIQNGCNNFCSYCIVPYTRGREVFRDYNQIIDELKYVDRMGVRVVTLLGQNVNSYKSGEKTFANLVEEIGKIKFDNVKWIYFDSPHIKDFNIELLDMLSQSEIFAKSFHVPVQSFSSKVLHDMNRKENEQDIYNFFNLARKKIPDAMFTTDIMVGFPTETEDDFNTTVNGLKKISFIDAFMYYYNPRPKTVAFAKYKDIGIDIKTKRLEKIIALQGDSSLALRKTMLGSIQDAVVKKISDKDDTKMLCYTQSNCAVLVDKPNIKTGDVISIRLKELNGRTFLGEKV